MKNYYIQFFSDNQPTVDALTNRTSSSMQLMTIIRIITLICLNFNIHFKISHIKGKDNIFADHLSCLKLDKFMQQVEESKDLVYLKPQGQAWLLSINMLKHWPQMAHHPVTHGVYDRAWQLFNRFLTCYNKDLHALCDLDFSGVHLHAFINTISRLNNLHLHFRSETPPQNKTST